jgi:hypothetical protein
VLKTLAGRSQPTLYATGIFATCFLSPMCFAQSKLMQASLCALQKKISEGKHVKAEVAGVYSLGLDKGTLEDAACPTEATWVELELVSQRNKEKPRELLDHSGRAYVVFKGEFYGPDVPDPKLPQAMARAYHPGWGHLGAFKTKLVVHSIQSVRAP